jgi:hypothetical protein
VWLDELEKVIKQSTQWQGTILYELVIDSKDNMYVKDEMCVLFAPVCVAYGSCTSSFGKLFLICITDFKVNASYGSVIILAISKSMYLVRRCCLSYTLR